MISCSASYSFGCCQSFGNSCEDYLEGRDSRRDQNEHRERREKEMNRVAEILIDEALDVVWRPVLVSVFSLASFTVNISSESLRVVNKTEAQALPWRFKQDGQDKQDEKYNSTPLMLFLSSLSCPSC